MNIRHKLWIINVLLGLTLSACGVLDIGIETHGSLGGEPTPVATPTGALTDTPATPTPLPTDSLQTYHNDEVGFELDYPADWVPDFTGISHGVILWSKTMEGLGTDGVPADVANLDVLGLPDVTQTLDELVAQQKQSLADTNGTVLSEERLQLASGVDGLHGS